MSVDPISMTIFHRRITGIAEEMALVLRKTAYSPNIKERADFSCAIYDGEGRSIAQAEAIPVHLGSMPFVAKPVIELFKGAWQDGDAIVTNSPRPGFGGTHLPDITLLAPVFENGILTHVVANRAHHADVGGMTPGSLPANSTEIFQEGLIIPPVRLFIAGKENPDVMNMIMENVRTPYERRGDLRAQYSSLMLGVMRLKELKTSNFSNVDQIQDELLKQSELAVKQKLKELPQSSATYVDYLDNDGVSPDPVKIQCTITIANEKIEFDFQGTDMESQGNCNAPFSVTQSACFYIVRLLIGTDIPTNEGCFRLVVIKAPTNCVVNPSSNAATSSANTETSSRIVDVLMGAMVQIIPWPSASQGTMNNLLIGGYVNGIGWSIYETIGGGTGGGPEGAGISAIQSHMTNTQNTPVEALELSYPLRVREYSIRKNSGGKGKFPGGDGIIREIELLSQATVTLQSERRKFNPWGQGSTKGVNAEKGRNLIYTSSDNNNERVEYQEIGSRVTFYNLPPNSRVRILTPGGGAFGDEP